MDEQKNLTDLDHYVAKGANIIYYIYVITSIIGFLADIAHFYHSSSVILYNNIITILITIISLHLYRFHIVNYSVSFGISIYAAMINFSVDSFINPFIPEKTEIFLRDNFFVIILITLASFLIHRRHAILITILYYIILIYFDIRLHLSIFNPGIGLAMLFVMVYASVIYYFVGILEKAFNERNRKNLLVRSKNETLNEVNALLKERQLQIEEQSEELIQQTEILQEQSFNLSQKNEELEKLNRMKDKFISILAHDLRNPLHVMIGFTEILETDFKNLKEADKMKYISILGSTSRKTYGLLENLLQWAKTQTNHIAFSPQPVALNRLLKNNVFFFLENYYEKKIIIVEDIEKDCFVYADENMLDTVIRNLFSNAIKFTPAGGKIYVSCNAKRNHAIVEIRDTGVGISEEGLSKIFRIDKSYSTMGTEGESGSGLGLLICKDFVEKNNGSLRVKSELGKGSCFTITLPLYESASRSENSRSYININR